MKWFDKEKPLYRQLTIFGDPVSKPACLLNAISKYTCQNARHRHPTQKKNNNDGMIINLHVDDKHIVELHLTLWDDAARDGSYRPPPRPSPPYAVSEMAVICFAVDSPDAVQNVENKWINEVLHFLIGVPIILVGCYSKTSENRRTLEQRKELVKKTGAYREVELSLDTGEGVGELLDVISQLSVSHGFSRRYVHCVVL